MEPIIKELLYEKSNAKEDSLLLSQSDVEHDSPIIDDELVDVPNVSAANVPTQINDDIANDSSQSQEVLSYKIPKRKQLALGEIEKTVKIRVQEEIIADLEADVDSQAYDVDTQKMLEDM